MLTPGRLRRPHLRRGRARSRGQAVVEFALILPVFLLLTLGVVDMARLFTSYISLTNGVSSAAIYAGSGSYLAWCASGAAIPCPAGTAAANKVADPANIAYQIQIDSTGLNPAQIVMASAAVHAAPPGTSDELHLDHPGGVLGRQGDGQLPVHLPDADHLERDRPDHHDRLDRGGGAQLIRSPFRRGGPRSRGQALVEFAFVLPIFLLILFSLIDFGRVIYAQHTINQDAAEGARVGAVSADTLVTNGDFTARYLAIRNAALGHGAGRADELADHRRSVDQGRPGARVRRSRQCRGRVLAGDAG